MFNKRTSLLLLILIFTVLVVSSLPTSPRTYMGESKHWKAELVAVEDVDGRGDTSFKLYYQGPALDNINSIEYTLSGHGLDLGFSDFNAELPSNKTFFNTGSGLVKPGDPIKCVVRWNIGTERYSESFSLKRNYFK